MLSGAAIYALSKTSIEKKTKYPPLQCRPYVEEEWRNDTYGDLQEAALAEYAGSKEKEAEKARLDAECDRDTFGSYLLSYFSTPEDAHEKCRRAVSPFRFAGPL